MYWNIAPSACRLVSHLLRQISSALRDLKNVSTMQCLAGDLHSKSAEKGIIPCPAAVCPLQTVRGITVSFAAHSLPGSACLHA